MTPPVTLSGRRPIEPPPARPPAETAPSSHPGELELTFRDPAGQLLLTPEYALRRIRPAAADETRRFLASPLREDLERSGDLVASQIAEAGIDAPAVPGDLWLRHPRIDPISYPWEWTRAQWRAAAELTLRVAGKAVDAGWMLKDATPLNVLFVGARPIFVDVLSFEQRDPHTSVWLAYGQFVRTFLLPLAGLKYLGWPLQATLLSRDGYEPASLFQKLTLRQRLNPNLLDVVVLATLLEKKSGSPQKPKTKPRVTDPELAKHILRKRLARLGKQIRRAAGGDGKSDKSEWSRYEQQASHYQSADVERKQAFVREALQRCGPKRVLDIGANTGTYSLMAAQAGAEVVALDSDGPALERLWSAAAARHLPVTALVANIARPTPAAGWRNREHLSLLDRLTGRFDLALMLAVIHHLILREQLPLEHIAALCAELTRQWLVVEWVPPSDPMFQEWLRGRDDLYGHLSEADLKNAFAPFFQVADRAELGNGRVLLLFERHESGKPPAGPDRQC